MITEFIKGDERFNSAEFKGVKAAAASREQYGDSAIGYVELKREGSLCTVQGRICPEHKVRSKTYSVCLIVDEIQEKIVNVFCKDCAASSGMWWLHALPFLMWMHRRSEDPAPTEVTSYLVKPRLSGVGTSKRFIKAEEFSQQLATSKTSILSSPSLNNSTFRQEVLNLGKQNQADGKIMSYNFGNIKQKKYDCASIYKLLLQFASGGGTDVHNFLSFATDKLLSDSCKEVERLTVKQSRSPMWHEVRYARVTASKIHELAKCTQKNKW
ncbi:hypothetical protein FQR65_LT16831 [Abscondita terminalis]|nr:hypothetical protein FQR65_LT16831 [Abscondita terminalis]